CGRAGAAVPVRPRRPLAPGPRPLVPGPWSLVPGPWSLVRPGDSGNEKGDADRARTRVGPDDGADIGQDRVLAGEDLGHHVLEGPEVGRSRVENGELLDVLVLADLVDHVAE